MINGVNVFLGVQNRDLLLDVNQHHAQPLFDRQRLEQPLGLVRLQVEMAGYQVGEAAGLGASLVFS